MATIRKSLTINDQTHMGKVILAAYKQTNLSLSLGDYMIEMSYKNILREIGHRKVLELEKNYVNEDIKGVAVDKKLKIERDNEIDNKNDVIAKQTEIESLEPQNRNKVLSNFKDPMKK